MFERQLIMFYSGVYYVPVTFSMGKVWWTRYFHGVKNILNELFTVGCLISKAMASLSSKALGIKE